MSGQVLAARAQLLQGELQRAKQNVVAATEQLEAAKAHLNMVIGHINEVAYLMSEEMKLAELAKQSEATADVAPIDSKEQGNGEAIEQEA